MRERNGFLNTAGLIALVFLAACGLFLIGMQIGEQTGAPEGVTRAQAAEALAAGLQSVGSQGAGTTPASTAQASTAQASTAQASSPTPSQASPRSGASQPATSRPPARPRPVRRPSRPVRPTGLRRPPIREMTEEEAGPIELPLPEDEDFVAEVNRLIEQFLRGRDARKQARDKILAYGRRAVPVLISRRNHPHMTVRWEVVNCGGYIGDPAQIPSICDNVMNDENPHIRWRGMWALSEYKDRSPIYAILEAHLDDTNSFTAWNAAVALTMVGSRKSLPQIHEGLKFRDGWKRWEAVNALQRVWSQESAELLIPIFQDGEKRHRQEAAMALSKIRGRAALAVLLDYAIKDNLAGVRWRACDALGACGFEEAIPVLEELARKDRDKDVRKHATKAISRIRSGR